MKEGNKYENERGIAVILAMSFLALFTISALLFTVTSITNRKTAENFSAQTTSRLSAQSGLQRAVTHLNYILEFNDPNDEDKRLELFDKLNSQLIYSDNSDDTISNEAKLESLGGTNGLLNTIIDNKIEYYTVANENYDTSTHPTWQYFPFNHSLSNPINGRFAYIVLSDFGKLDPNACVDSGNGITAISEDAPINEATSVNVIGRPGRNINEIFLDCLPSSWFTTTYAQNMSSVNASPPGKLQLYNNKPSWIDIYNFFDELNINESHYNSFKQLFSLESVPVPEAFWVDDDADNIRENNELFHRFNLSGTNWDSLTVSDLTNTANAFTASQGGGINWLANWNYSGEMSTDTVCKNQIAANIIDYNDINTIATTDDEDSPTYVGLEKCPYINELKLEIEGEVQIPSPSSSSYILFANDYLYINSSSMSLSSYNDGVIAHANDDLYLHSGLTCDKTITYTGRVYNSSGVTTESASSETSPVLTDLSDYQTQANSTGTTYTGDIVVENGGSGKVKITGTNISGASQKNDGCVIYTTGNITINKSFSRSVTLISERGDVSITGNTVVSITPAFQDLLIYAGHNITINSSVIAANGTIMADNDIYIFGASINISNAFIWCNDDLIITGASVNISHAAEIQQAATDYTCNVYLKDAQLELVDMYGTSINSQADITLNGSYNWIVDGVDSEVNFSKNINLGITGSSNAYSTSNSFDLTDSDISPTVNIRSESSGLNTSIENFTIDSIKVKLMDSNSNLLDFSFIEPLNNYANTGTEAGGVNIDGDLNINPGSMNSSHPFIMQTVDDGEINVDNIKDWGSNVTYSGAATEIRIKAKSPGQGGTSININGEEVNLATNTYYTFTGDMTIYLYNTHNNANKTYGKANGKWWINITGSNIIITPEIGESTVGEGETSTYTSTLSLDGSIGTLYLNCEVADPRNNLEPGTWNNPTFKTNDTNTIGVENTRWIPAGDGVDSDMESSTAAPWEVSTAYIRNSAMQSPWELGFIHRGADFQTINLKKYNSNSDIGAGGGEDYSYGDANILNQIKMTPDTETYGKININSKLQEVLTLLFEKINVGSDISSSDGPGVLANEIDNTYASALAAEVLDNNSTNNGNMFLTRAHIVRDINGLTNALSSDGAVQTTDIQLSRDTDAEQEEIIGKLINLTDASLTSNVFHIIVVVQTIQDIGSNNERGITVKRDMNHDGDTNDENETISGCKIGSYDQYADNILATQKILVTVVRDITTGKFKIKRFEYIE